MKLVYRNPNELKSYGNNPRHNDQAVKAVLESMKRYGFRNPILITKDNEIIAGHTRKEAAIQLGAGQVPCILIEDMDEKQVKEFRLVDNKTAEFASWDMEKLLVELAEIANQDMNDIFRFPDIDIDRLEVRDEDFLQDTEIVRDRETKKAVKCPKCGEEFEV